MTVRKKTAAKKRVSKKSAVKKIMPQDDVMAHDPLSMIDDTLSMLSEPMVDDNDFGESLATSESEQQEQTLDSVLNEMAEEQLATLDEPEVSVEAEFSAEMSPDTTQINVESDISVESPTNEDSNWSGGEFHLGDSLTIMDAETRKNDFLKIIVDGMSVTLDASELEQVDGAGLQLLAAFYKDAMRKGVAVSWNKISRSLDNAVTIMGMKEALGLRDVDIEDSGEGVTWGLF